MVDKNLPIINRVIKISVEYKAYKDVEENGEEDREEDGERDEE